jgi:hypothetical protein
MRVDKVGTGTGNMYKDVQVSKVEYDKYEAVRQSGACNMWDVGTVVELTGLTRGQISYIRGNYGTLKTKYEGE